MISQIIDALERLFQAIRHIAFRDIIILFLVMILGLSGYIVVWTLNNTETVVSVLLSEGQIRTPIGDCILTTLPDRADRRYVVTKYVTKIGSYDILIGTVKNTNWDRDEIDFLCNRLVEYSDALRSYQRNLQDPNR